MNDDRNMNMIPEDVKSVHLTAICGTGMAALAAMLKEKGIRVTGSDKGVYPPMSLFLRDRGMEPAEGFSAENLSYGPDLVIIGNSVRKDNPEAVYVREAGLPYCSMPQAVNRFAAAGKKILLVTGTHGKTTTSSILAWLLHSAGLDPSFMIGGIVRDFDGNYRTGKGGHMVIEGDEYDTAFFDKGPKFLHYKPFVTVLTGIEFDHADIYRDLGHVKSSFEKLVQGMPENALLAAFDDDENVREVVTGCKCRVKFYGKGENSEIRTGNVSFSSRGTVFEAFIDEQLHTFETGLAGEHNLMNSLAAIAAARHAGISPDKIREGLKSFSGVKRRQEIVGVKNGITVMDDFAHHPTAVKETLKAVRPCYAQGRIIAVFEPRTNTSMRNVFQEAYTLAFDAADIVCIRKPPLLEKIPEGERFSSEKLVEDLKRRGKNAQYFPATEAIIDFAAKEAREDDLVIIMSNGGFDNIHERLLKAMG